jgi:hypothetical protein
VPSLLGSVFEVSTVNCLYFKWSLKMKTNIMTSVVAGLLLVCAGLANAAEPVALTDRQMDSVAAGTVSTVAAAGGISLITTTAHAVSIGRFQGVIASATAMTLEPGRGAVAGSYAGAVAY